jgi:hypothetical protein
MENPSYNFLLPIAIFPVCFILLWLLVGAIIARLGGWRELAQYYQDPNQFSGERRLMQSARMRRGTNYNGCLNISINDQGLRIETIILFRFSHPPLFIPWYDIQSAPKQLLFFEAIEFRFAKNDQVPFLVRKKLGEWILAAKKN